MAGFKEKLAAANTAYILKMQGTSKEARNVLFRSMARLRDDRGENLLYTDEQLADYFGLGFDEVCERRGVISSNGTQPIELSNLPLVIDGEGIYRRTVKRIKARRHEATTVSLPKNGQIFDDIFRPALGEEEPPSHSPVHIQTSTDANSIKPMEFVEPKQKADSGIIEDESLRRNIRNAFLRGFATGIFQTKNLGSKGEVYIGSGSQDEEKIDLLRKTFGKVGRIKDDRKEEVRVYLDSDEFDFVCNPEGDKDEIEKITQSRELFAPFVLGVLFAKLTRIESRVPIKDSNIAFKIPRAFRSHFGVEIGERRYWTSTKKYQILVKEPRRIFEILFKEPSVQSLPFFEDLVNSSFLQNRKIRFPGFQSSVDEKS
ncbi:MAG: hypothetical protein AAB675_02930 [Patescibacteria group bacterium]